ncbi:ParB/RepB/Spo0J family partition protein [Streptomyces anulatus]|uniref:ParB/RepB/Spo0J family partition protein n=1 Tax=Streptomyces anulatus TaxID=1892 RepID=UPI00341D20AE
MAGMPNRDLSRTRNAASTQRLFGQAAPELPISDLLPSPENGRKKIRNVHGLASSLDDDGVVQALTVVTAATYIEHYPQHKAHVEASGKPYVVLHGHRRLAAAEKRGLEKVPVFLRKRIDGSIRLAAIKENEQRLGLDPIEQGADYQAALEELGVSQRELARKLGSTSQTAISHRIKLLKLIPSLREAVIDHWCKQNGLEFEHGGELLLPVKEAATVLAGLRAEMQQAFADGALSFAAAEAIVKSKVPLDKQQLPSSDPDKQTQADPPAGGSQQSTKSTPDSPADAETGEPQPNGDGGEKNPVPTQRSSPNDSDEGGDERQDEAEEQGISQTGSAGTENSGGNDTSQPPAVPTTKGPAQGKTKVATIAERGVIQVTTVQNIYASLKERLTKREFEELQDLILAD